MATLLVGISQDFLIVFSYRYLAFPVTFCYLLQIHSYLQKYNHFLSENKSMVQLQFNVEVFAPFEAVWKYFGQFQNITDWDPNTKGIEVIRKNQKEVGSVYNIITVFNEKESTVSYETMEFKQTNDRGYINLEGKNDQITAKDQIICARKGPNTTLVTYRAEISLRGFLWLFTPFIRSGLNTITEQAKNGCLKRAREKWGKAEAVV